MDPQAYAALSDQQILSLCVWREARGEGFLGKRGVAHVIRNRASEPSWWGHDIRTVILKPYQFSSFNANDPNADKWPEDADPSWADCQEAATWVLAGTDNDITSGAQFYYDISIPEPEWAADYTLTLVAGRLRFYKI